MSVKSFQLYIILYVIEELVKFDNCQTLSYGGLLSPVINLYSRGNTINNSTKRKDLNILEKLTVHE